MEISKLYNLVPVKDNCALFAPTPQFSGPGCSMMSLIFFPCRPLLPWQRIIFGTKLTITWHPWKIIVFTCPLFSGPGYAVVSCKFFPWRLLLSW